MEKKKTFVFYFSDDYKLHSGVLPRRKSKEKIHKGNIYLTNLNSIHSSEMEVNTREL